MDRPKENEGPKPTPLKEVIHDGKDKPVVSGTETSTTLPYLLQLIDKNEQIQRCDWFVWQANQRQLRSMQQSKTTPEICFLLFVPSSKSDFDNQK